MCIRDRNEIEFTYHTPGLKVSAIVSVAGIAAYGIYLLILRKRAKDVYKRQGVHIGNGHIGVGQCLVHGGADIFRVAAAGDLRHDTAVAVSYTHLDVYKRQPKSQLTPREEKFNEMSAKLAHKIQRRMPWLPRRLNK